MDSTKDHKIINKDRTRIKTDRRKKDETATKRELIARKMFSEGYSENVIFRITGFSVKEL